MICENCGAEMRFKQVGHSISWICDNCGEAVASTCFEKAPAEIFSGKAIDIMEIKEKLEAANIDFKIEPEFPY